MRLRYQWLSKIAGHDEIYLVKEHMFTEPNIFNTEGVLLWAKGYAMRNHNIVAIHQPEPNIVDIEYAPYKDITSYDRIIVPTGLH